MKLEIFFQSHPVFTGPELSHFLASYKPLGARDRESLLAYHKKTGRVIQVRNNLFAVVPSKADPGTYPVDSFLLAARMTKDAVLAFHTALEFHGHAYSAQHILRYLALRPVPPVTFRKAAFRGTKFPTALIRKDKTVFEVVTMERLGMELTVTSLERTIVDVLDRPNLSGSWEEIWRSLESVGFLDLDKVVAYTLLLENATTAAKVGFYLEQHRESLMVEDKYLKILRDLGPKQALYLNRNNRRTGRLVSGWNLVVPTEILDRTWTEVL
jgi:predicted transcriptional regulator of viral defense system